MDKSKIILSSVKIFRFLRRDYKYDKFHFQQIVVFHKLLY